MVFRIRTLIAGTVASVAVPRAGWAQSQIEPMSGVVLPWTLAVLAGAAAVVLGWRYHRLHRRLEGGMGEMERTLGQLRDTLREQTLALENAGEQLEAQRQTIEELRLTDRVTGLWTRQHVFRLLSTHGARALRNWVAWNNGIAKNKPENADLLIFIVGLDKLSEATVALGNDVVDAVLQEFADVLRTTSRSTDVLARWGDAEFMVVRSGTDRSSERELAERLRESVASHVFSPTEEMELSTTCSIGFAGYPLLTHAPDAVDWRDVVNLAQSALDAARRTGRNSWVGILGDASTPTEGLPELLETGPVELIRKERLKVLTSLDSTSVIRWEEP